MALDLYFRVNPLHTSEAHPAIQGLSALLNALPIHAERPAQEVFRNPNGVYMKLCNYLRFDPTYTGRGLTRGGKAEEAVWAEFAGDQERLRRTAAAIRSAQESVTPSEVKTEVPEPDEEFAEGRILTALHKLRERSPALVKRKKEQVLKSRGALQCEVCGFDFEKRYGVLGSGFAECHHRAPLAALSGQSRTTLSDLAIVCANCHRMIHRSRPMLTVEELRKNLGEADAPSGR